MTQVSKKVEEQPKNANADKKVEKSPLKVVKDEKTPEAKQKPKKAVSRIEKLDTFNRLAQKHEHLSGKKKELENFKASNDGMTAQVQFVTGTGGEHLKVTNASVIDKLVKAAEVELEVLLTNCEDEIELFEI